MEGNFFSQIVPFLAIVIFILIHLPASLCAVNEQYANCSRSYKCSNISITYPFYTLSTQPFRPSYCGSGNSRFNLDCQDGVLTTNTLFLDKVIIYRVLAINESTETVTVARNDYWDSYCPTVYRNTTLDSLDKFLWTVNYDIIHMYYGCPSNITGYANRQFTCIGNRTNTTIGYYFTDYDLNSTAVAACDIYVSIPASRSALQTLTASPSQWNLMTAIHGGLEMRWRADNHLCTGCVESGGRCGSNATSAESEFICYCPDGPYPYVCVTGSSSTTNITGSSSGLNIRLKFAIG